MDISLNQSSRVIGDDTFSCYKLLHTESCKGKICANWNPWNLVLTNRRLRLDCQMLRNRNQSDWSLSFWESCRLQHVSYSSWTARGSAVWSRDINTLPYLRFSLCVAASFIGHFDWSLTGPRRIFLWTSFPSSPTCCTANRSPLRSSCGETTINRTDQYPLPFSTGQELASHRSQSATDGQSLIRVWSHFEQSQRQFTQSIQKRCASSQCLGPHLYICPTKALKSVFAIRGCLNSMAPVWTVELSYTHQSKFRYVSLAKSPAFMASAFQWHSQWYCWMKYRYYCCSSDLGSIIGTNS